MNHVVTCTKETIPQRLQDLSNLDPTATESLAQTQYAHTTGDDMVLDNTYSRDNVHDTNKEKMCERRELDSCDLTSKSSTGMTGVSEQQYLLVSKEKGKKTESDNEREMKGFQLLCTETLDPTELEGRTLLKGNTIDGATVMRGHSNNKLTSEQQRRSMAVRRRPAKSTTKKTTCSKQAS